MSPYTLKDFAPGATPVIPLKLSETIMPSPVSIPEVTTSMAASPWLSPPVPVLRTPLTSMDMVVPAVAVPTVPLMVICS